MDHGWRYDDNLLTWKWNHFHQRLYVSHPAKPSSKQLGYADVFMGWTLAEARQCIQEANAVLTHDER